MNMAPEPDEQDHECECPCHEGGSHSYRLMQGSSVEGISIREVITDKSGEVMTWTDPISPPAASREEAQDDLELQIKELKQMREAFRQPILDELDLEAEIEVNE